ncbi:hypothetical protein [Pseudomonas sp. NPDC089401]|uniref:hypothetical protein n=1 Tax=Pseudomonas sp. NPDC089401 TaxID=3364462 RepID=UPI0037F8FDB7
MCKANFLLILRVVLAAPCMLFFLLLSVAAKMAGDPPFIGGYLGIALFSGIVPLISWLALIFFAGKKNLIKLLFFSVFATMFHYVVAAFHGHADPWYWWLQPMEIALLLVLVNLLKNNRFFGRI